MTQIQYRHVFTKFESSIIYLLYLIVTYIDLEMNENVFCISFLAKYYTSYKGDRELINDIFTFVR